MLLLDPVVRFFYWFGVLEEGNLINLIIINIPRLYVYACALIGLLSELDMFFFFMAARSRTILIC